MHGALASFHKSERLTSAQHIEQLFDRTGRTFKCFPLLFIVKPTAFIDQSIYKALISVSKKKFKRAVDRNLLKRRIRAAHQINKHKLVDLLSQKGGHSLGIIYMANHESSFNTIEVAYNSFLNDLVKSNL